MSNAIINRHTISVSAENVDMMYICAVTAQYET